MQSGTESQVYRSLFSVYAVTLNIGKRLKPWVEKVEEL